MTDLLTVKSGHKDKTVALWDKDDRHPDGEVFIACDGEFQVARTRAVETALKAGRLVEVKAVEPETVLPPEPTPLPADFPAYSVLVKAGYDTVEAVRAASDEDLDKLDGIGPATLKAIREAQ